MIKTINNLYITDGDSSWVVGLHMSDGSTYVYPSMNEDELAVAISVNKDSKHISVIMLNSISNEITSNKFNLDHSATIPAVDWMICYNDNKIYEYLKENDDYVTVEYPNSYINYIMSGRSSINSAYGFLNIEKIRRDIHSHYEQQLCSNMLSNIPQPLSIKYLYSYDDVQRFYEKLISYGKNVMFKVESFGDNVQDIHDKCSIIHKDEVPYDKVFNVKHPYIPCKELMYTINMYRAVYRSIDIYVTEPRYNKTSFELITNDDKKEYVKIVSNDVMSREDFLNCGNDVENRHDDTENYRGLILEYNNIDTFVEAVNTFSSNDMVDSIIFAKRYFYSSTSTGVEGIYALGYKRVYKLRINDYYFQKTKNRGLRFLGFGLIPFNEALISEIPKLEIFGSYVDKDGPVRVKFVFKNMQSLKKKGILDET